MEAVRAVAAAIARADLREDHRAVDHIVPRAGHLPVIALVRVTAPAALAVTDPLRPGLLLTGLSLTGHLPAEPVRTGQPLSVRARTNQVRS